MRSEKVHLVVGRYAIVERRDDNEEIANRFFTYYAEEDDTFTIGSDYETLAEAVTTAAENTIEHLELGQRCLATSGDYAYILAINERNADNGKPY